MFLNSFHFLKQESGKKQEWLTIKLTTGEKGTMNDYTKCIFCDREIAHDRYAAIYKKKVICTQCIDNLVRLRMIRGDAQINLIRERRDGVERTAPKFFIVPN